MADLLADVLATADARPEAAALTTPAGGTLTGAALAGRIRACAAGLRAAGMAPGDRVLFSVRPEIPGIVLALAIVAAGGTVVFADPGVGRELFASRVGLVGPRWAAAESLLYALGAGRARRALARRRGLLLPDLAGLDVRHLVTGRWLPGVPRTALRVDRLEQDGARALAAAASEPASERGGVIARRPGQPAVVVFTSGTTSAPRAVVHTRGSLGASARALPPATAIGPGDVVHTDQLMVGLPALAAGAHWTLPPFGLAPRADPLQYAAGLAQATVTFTVPADLAVLLDAVEAGRVPLPPRLRTALVGGAPVLPALVRRVHRLLPGVEVLAVYGMTEMAPVAIVSGAEKLAHTGSGDLIGVPLPGVGARLAEDGELLLSGSWLSTQLLGEAPLTEHHTGDLAAWDDGRLVLTGRSKDMIIRGWTNVYPGLYEPALSAIPGVGAALLVGVPDEFGDEEVVLAVVGEGRGSSEHGVTVITDPALAAAATAGAGQVVGAAARPDRVVVLDALPVRGRALKPDRDAIRSAIAAADRAAAQRAVR